LAWKPLVVDNPEADTLLPISELWDKAYKELELDDATSHLIRQYKAEIEKQITDHEISTVEITRL